MSRLAATVTSPASFADGVSATLRGIGKLFVSEPGNSGLEALEREHDRIRLTSRHWLVG